MNREELLAYQRGYATGRRGSWPAHRPPSPPEDLSKELFEAARNLRDRADNVCSVLSDDDEFVGQLAPGIDAIDEILGRTTDWLYGPAASADREERDE